VTATKTLSWRERNVWVADLLQRRTGASVEEWNRRIRELGFTDERSLRDWLSEQCVAGYPQMMLVMERFGYPEFLVASANQLIDGQYADRQALRTILDAVLARVVAFADVTIQTRKTYVSLVTPKRTFATVEPTTRSRVDVGLRIPAAEARGRAEPARSMGQSAMTARIGLTSVDEVDDEVESWLLRAYEENS